MTSPKRKRGSPSLTLRAGRTRSQLPHEGYQRLLFLSVQLQFEDEVEELHRILEGRKPTVVEVRRRFLDSTQRERLDRALRRGHQAVVRLLLIETIDLEVVHHVIGVERG